MPTVKELLQSGRKDELWQMCCGFLDLNIDQFMAIQKSLLREQIEFLNNSYIGKKIFGGTIPQDVDEFRKRVPLTTYKDYCPELSERKEECLPVKPVFWQHTSGRSTEYPFKWESIKWVPIPPGAYKELSNLTAACAMLSSCKRRGDASAMKKGLKFIYAVAPRPYTSGSFAYLATEEVAGISLPELDQAEKMQFEERLSISFKQALSDGFDFYFGVSVALIAIGEKINQQMQKIDIKPLLAHPKALLRATGGLIKSKLAKRALLPKDLWNVKGIIGGGTDCNIFRELIKSTWGKNPLNVYVSTEAGVAAMQAWDFQDMYFVPTLNFLEFIPESEYDKWQMDNMYQPYTILLDEVKPGGKYELVITNFHGGALARYRTGDVIKINSLKNEHQKINLPQMEFEGRVDDTLDIGGFVRLNEKVIWQAVSNTNIPHVDWVARKEMKENLPILHLFIELKDNFEMNDNDIAKAVYTELKKMDEDFMYGNIEDLLKTMPITISLLPTGAFKNYINYRQSQGADLAHLKPRHINPSDKELAILGVSAAESEITGKATQVII